MPWRRAATDRREARLDRVEEAVLLGLARVVGRLAGVHVGARHRERARGRCRCRPRPSGRRRRTRGRPGRCAPHGAAPSSARRRRRGPSPRPRCARRAGAPSPASSSTSASCSSVARTSCRQSTSAPAAASQSRPPRLAAARMPLTLAVTTVSTRSSNQPPRRTAERRAAPRWEAALRSVRKRRQAMAFCRFSSIASRNCSVVSHGASGAMSRARSLVILPSSTVSMQTRSRVSANAVTSGVPSILPR